MKKIAYIISREDEGEIIEQGFLIPFTKGSQNIRIVALYFVGEGVYHLIKGNRISKIIDKVIADKKCSVAVCRESVQSRLLKNLISNTIQSATLEDFYKLAESADHIICY